MTDKENTGRIRESSGATDIGTAEDGGILEMLTMVDRIMIIKEKAIYEFYLADAIDPGRTNINLPTNIQSLLIDQGADSELVGRTFLTAKTLFKKEGFDATIDLNKALLFSLDALLEFIALEQGIANILELERKATELYEQRRLQGSNFAIPSIPGIETKCKTIFQKVDHIEQIILDIVKIFFSQLSKKAFHVFLEFLQKEYSKDDPFAQYVEKILYFLNLARELRNSLDHRLPHHKVRNFELQTDGNIITPTIEINFKRAKLDRVSLSVFLPQCFENLLTIFENIIVGVSDLTGGRNILTSEVRQIPEDQRRYKHVAYSFWSPLGEGGFYNQ